MESFTPYLLTAEPIDRDPLLTLESSDQLLIFCPVAPIYAVLGQICLALADAPPAPNELLWERFQPVLVVVAAPLTILEVSAVGTIGAVLWADVVTVRPRELCARPWDLPRRLRLGRLRLGRLRLGRLRLGRLRLGRRLALERSVHGLNQLSDPAAVLAGARRVLPVLMPVVLHGSTAALNVSAQLHQRRPIAGCHLRPALDPDSGAVALIVAGVPCRVALVHDLCEQTIGDHVVRRASTVASVSAQPCDHVRVLLPSRSPMVDCDALDRRAVAVPGSARVVSAECLDEFVAHASVPRFRSAVRYSIRPRREWI